MIILALLIIQIYYFDLRRQEEKKKKKSAPQVSPCVSLYTFISHRISARKRPQLQTSLQNCPIDIVARMQKSPHRINTFVRNKSHFAYPLQRRGSLETLQGCFQQTRCCWARWSSPFFFFKQLSSPTWINAATGRVVPPCIAGPKARIFLVSGRPGGGGDCFWTLANTKQPAWGLLQRARVKPVSYQGAEPEVLASWEMGGGAVGC